MFIKNTEFVIYYNFPKKEVLFYSKSTALNFVNTIHTPPFPKLHIVVYNDQDIMP